MTPRLLTLCLAPICLTLSLTYVGESWADCDFCTLAPFSATRVIYFGGHRWKVRSSGSNLSCPPAGAGNYWSDDSRSVWVDSDGMLHLKIRNDPVLGPLCAEVVCDEIATYGTQRFYVISRLDQLPADVVFGMFLYRDDCHELDIEFSRWGNPNDSRNGTYSMQAPVKGGNATVFTFPAILTGDYTTHAIDWQYGSIGFRSWHGHYASPPGPDYIIADWGFSSPLVPEQSRLLQLHINLWVFGGWAPVSRLETEVVIKSADATTPVQRSSWGRVKTLYR